MIALPPIAPGASRERIRDWLADEEHARVAALLAEADLALGGGEAIVTDATGLISAIRERQHSGTGVNALLNEYSLSSREGVVLMCLAEALLRVPDSLTADRLIRDKIGSGDWRAHVGGSSSLFVNASAWGLLLTGKVIELRGSDADSAWTMLRRTVGRAGEPAIRSAMRLAMRIMGTQFVLGTDIASALEKSREWQSRGYRYSYDMLGEGARDSTYAREYFEGYCDAITAVGRQAGGAGPVEGPGFSVKLSALHPRFEFLNGERLRRELVPRVLELAQLARRFDIGLTIDAEEANRLDPTLDVLEAVFRDDSLRGWEGLGLAVQAYLKGAPAVIDWLRALAASEGRRLMVRLVKGAYWDAQIKHAQMLGLGCYPVFTRKTSTDLSWLVCAKRLLDARAELYPQFATHNAHSAAAVLAMAGSRKGFEFQRLHGMGEELYEELLESRGAGVPARIYAPVGVHQDLLAYLVRRLLENGANSSFVHNIADHDIPAAQLAADPREKLRDRQRLGNSSIPLPSALFGPSRPNARGLDLQLARDFLPLVAGLDSWREHAARLDCGVDAPGAVAVRNPARHEELLGHYRSCSAEDINDAATAALACTPHWGDTPASERAQCLRRAAVLIEDALPELAGFCIHEAGKTLRDAVADVREAVDFCRYYATEAEHLDAHDLPRGVLLCISPWNFPVAIFTGQVSAALAAGNTVIAKPAEQTTLVALRLASLFHEAGVPQDALHLLCGPGEPVGAELLPDPRIAGVLFTGSTAVARLIARTLAARGGARALLVAETGGQNAMVVDSTALLEQVVDDVIASGFNSAGQRCSALRVLMVQQDVADKLIGMLRAAMDELVIGDPADPCTDVGPIIDGEACARLEAHVARLHGHARLLHACTLPPGTADGSFFAPRLYEIDSLEMLGEEVFGPVVHLLRFDATELEQIPARINAMGYGLTFGVHSRIQSSIDLLSRGVHAGNVYVNRNIIGAVVGVQPFGGRGLSGTGPKAGGPLYLPRLLRPIRRTRDWRPVDSREHGLQLGDVFACRPLVAALRDAGEDWAATPLQERCGPVRVLSTHRRLERGAQTVSPHGHGLDALIAQSAVFAQSRELPGPTGESNTLSFDAHGLLALLCREGMDAELLLEAAVAALLAGNTVLFMTDAPMRGAVMRLRQALSDAGFPDTASAQQLFGDAAGMALALGELDIDGAICCTDPALTELASRALAAREGAILPLIDEEPGPYFLARFGHEKTVSVNTTAAGGNAALMSQTEGD